MMAWVMRSGKNPSKPTEHMHGLNANDDVADFQTILIISAPSEFLPDQKTPGL